MNNTKINQEFLAAYIRLDKACAEKLDTRTGVTEYIGKLTNMRFAPSREKILPSLIKYRKIRNRIAHEPDAMKEIDRISKEDILWLKALEKDVMRGRDPVSKYLKKAGRELRHRAFVRTLLLAAGALLVLLILLFIILL